MIDSVIKGLGNSRYLRSALTGIETWEQFRNALAAGTLPIDVFGINPDGYDVIGTPLDKATLLDDDVASMYGISPRTPSEAFGRILNLFSSDSCWIFVRVKLPDGSPYANCRIACYLDTTLSGYRDTPLFVDLDEFGGAVIESPPDTPTLIMCNNTQHSTTHLSINGGDVLIGAGSISKQISVSEKTSKKFIVCDLQMQVETTAFSDRFFDQLWPGAKIRVYSNIASYSIAAIGGGGAGGSRHVDNPIGGGGGGGGYRAERVNISPDIFITSVVIGAGGEKSKFDESGSLLGDGCGGDGGSTIISFSDGAVVVANGGRGGFPSLYSPDRSKDGFGGDGDGRGGNGSGGNTPEPGTDSESYATGSPLGSSTYAGGGGVGGLVVNSSGVPAGTGGRRYGGTRTTPGGRGPGGGGCGGFGTVRGDSLFPGGNGYRGALFVRWTLR